MPSMPMEASSSAGRTNQPASERLRSGSTASRTHPHPERRIQWRGVGGQRGRQYNRGRRLQFSRRRLDLASCHGCRTDRDRGKSLTLLDVSDDGKTAVGFTREGANGGHQRAFIWRDGRGAILLAKYLADFGVVVPEGWDLTVASLISADGHHDLRLGL